jgi:hypothetical protein
MTGSYISTLSRSVALFEGCFLQFGRRARRPTGSKPMLPPTPGPGSTGVNPEEPACCRSIPIRDAGEQCNLRRPLRSRTKRVILPESIMSAPAMASAPPISATTSSLAAEIQNFRDLCGKRYIFNNNFDVALSAADETAEVRWSSGGPAEVKAISSPSCSALALEFENCNVALPRNVPFPARLIPRRTIVWFEIEGKCEHPTYGVMSHSGHGRHSAQSLLALVNWTLLQCLSTEGNSPTGM